MSNRDEFDEEDLDDQSHGSVDDDGDEDENDVGNDFQPSTNTPSSPGIPTPVPRDVICGRGKMTSSHPGNRKLRDLVLQKKHEYQRAKRRDEKTSITSEIVQVLRGSGSKFLLFDDTTRLWHDVGDEYAKEKVSHSLRSRPTGHRRTRPKTSKKSVIRKSENSPAIDNIVHKLLHEQQNLLQAMIKREMTRSDTLNAGPGLSSDDMVPDSGR